MKIQNVKGGYDYLPREQIIRNYINNTLKETFEEYGYLPIETPILCYYDILAGKYDESNDILNEIYKLTDQGNRKLGLRYDLTVPFAKFIALNKKQIKLPFKRYEINKVFRDGPVKVGRDREFTQCDVDVVGLSNQAIEAELLNLYVAAFTKLNIAIEIKYNSRKLMIGLLEELKIPSEKISSVITIIDKIDKISKEEFQNYLIDIGISNQVSSKILKIFTFTFEELTNKYSNSVNNNLKEGLTELKELESYLKYLEIDKYCTFSPSLVRGQDYYTGNVFEVYEKNHQISSAIGGGGRYDNMITDFINDGESYPAVGISFGLSCIYELLKDNTKILPSPIDLYIIPLNTLKESLKLANKLRNQNLKVEVEMQPRKIKKSLDYANKENIPYIIILGEDELKSNKLKIRNMNNKIETEISLDNISKIVSVINSK